MLKINLEMKEKQKIVAAEGEIDIEDLIIKMSDLISATINNNQIFFLFI